MDDEPRTSVTIASNVCAGQYWASRITFESVNATEIVIAPTITSFFKFDLFSELERNGKAAAASNDPAIEASTSQRQGNCVSCIGLSSDQTGRLRGTDINNARTSSAMTGRVDHPADRAFFNTSKRAGANSISVISARMFIHHTLRFSGENVDRRKLSL